MGISEVITKHYHELRVYVKHPDVSVENGNTQEDVFQNVMVTAIKKYKGDVDEAEALYYLKMTLGAEMFFQVRKKKRDLLLFPGVSFEQAAG